MLKPIALAIAFLAVSAAGAPWNIDTSDPEQWDPANLSLNGLIQTRYQFNYSANNALDDQVTTGFEIARARVRARWTPSQWLRAEIQTDTGGSRTALRVIDAVGELQLADGVRVRFGRHRLQYSREYATSITRQLGMDRSIVDRTLGVLRSEFINLRLHGDRTRAEFFVHDGSRGAVATSFDDPREANVGLTARVSHLLLGDDFGTFRDFSVFRGTDPALLGGIGLSYDDGDNGIPDVFRATADLSYENNGLGLHGSFYLRHGIVDPDDPNGDQGTDDPTDLGFLVQTSRFVTDTTELFGRYSVVVPDSARTNDDPFHELTAGLNHFIIPESHAFKLTAELIWYPTATTKSIVRPSARVGLIESDADQVVARAQIQLQF